MKVIKSLSKIILVGSIALTGTVFAQDDVSNYPDRPVTWIVPFSAGGGADTWTRIMASKAEEVWGVPFLVQNRPGQGGTRGWQAALNEPAEGYTILHASPTPIITLVSQNNPPIQPKDIKMVGFLGSYETVIAASSDDPWANWDELVKYAEQNPGKLTIGGTNAPLLAVAYLFDQAGIDVTYIPYPGSGAATTDYLGGHIDMLATTTTSGVSLLPDEAVLVVNTSGEQLPQNAINQIKEVGSNVPPSATDLGFDGFSFPRWVGVHPETPDETVSRLSDLLGELMANESVRSKISMAGEEVNYIGHKEAQQRYNKLVESLEVSTKLVQ